MDETWTLDQTLAWVRWRDLRIVEALERGTYGAMNMWPPSKLGYGTPQDLLKALRAGKISARGRRNGQGDREIISDLQWHDLVLQPQGLQPACARPDDNGPGTIWTDLKFDAKTLRKCFPATGIEAAIDSMSWIGKPAKTAVSEAADWYLRNYKPEPTHGWRAIAHNTLQKLEGLKQLSLDTIRKYSKSNFDTW